MNKLFCHSLVIVSSTLWCFTACAVDMSGFSRNIPAAQADELARSTLIGIFESCGNASNLEDKCVLQGLERVAREEDNTAAQAMLSNYDKALATGNADTPECQTQAHTQANRIIGHCMLLLNFYMLQSGDQESATNKYETCLQGGMLGLTYQGNIAAQYFMAQLYTQRGIASSAQTWQNALKSRKDSSEYELLMKCYR